MSKQDLPATTSLVQWTGEFMTANGEKSKTKCRKELTALVTHAQNGTTPDPAPAEDSATVTLLADLGQLLTAYDGKKTAVVNEVMRVAWIRYAGEPSEEPEFNEPGKAGKPSGGARPSGCSAPPEPIKPAL